MTTSAEWLALAERARKVEGSDRDTSVLFADLIDRAENVVIAFGLGWDLEGVIDCLEKAVKNAKAAQAKENNNG